MLIKKIFFSQAACGIPVPQPGIKPAFPALGAHSLNHWTAKEVPTHSFLRLGAPLRAAPGGWPWKSLPSLSPYSAHPFECPCIQSLA